MINIYREKIKVKIRTKTLPKPQNQVKNIFQKTKKKEAKLRIFVHNFRYRQVDSKS